MNLLKILALSMAGILFCSFAKAPSSDSFAINDDMAPSKWARRVRTISSPNSLLPISDVFREKIQEADVYEYFRKVNPGSIVHLDCYIASQPSGQSSLMPLHYSFDIPVRIIDEQYGNLKNYEKDFLLSYLATNTKEIFTSVPTDAALLRLWNFIMKNLWLTKEREPGSLVKVKVDYRKLNTDLLDGDATFRPHLGPLSSTFQEVMLPRTTSANISGFFEKSLTGNVPSPKFYNGDVSADRFFSFISFSVIVDGAYYAANQFTKELSTWSIYDWVHSGIPIYEDNGKNMRLKYVVFKENHGRYRVLYRGETPGRVVRYAAGDEDILYETGKDKTISEEDLVNIFPSAVKRLIFK